MQVHAENNWQQNDQFLWNQIRDMDDETTAPSAESRTTRAPKSANPFHIVASFFRPIFNAFHSTALALKTSFNDTKLPFHGKPTS